MGESEIDLPTIGLRNIQNGDTFESDIEINNPNIGLIIQIKGGNFVVSNINEAGNYSSLQGLSTDVKPTEGVPSGSTFYELDQVGGVNRTWIYDIYNTNPATGDGWWGV